MPSTDWEPLITDADMTDCSTMEIAIDMEMCKRKGCWRLWWTAEDKQKKCSHGDDGVDSA